MKCFALNLNTFRPKKSIYFQPEPTAKAPQPEPTQSSIFPYYSVETTTRYPPTTKSPFRRQFFESPATKVVPFVEDEDTTSHFQSDPSDNAFNSVKDRLDNYVRPYQAKTPELPNTPR